MAEEIDSAEARARGGIQVIGRAAAILRRLAAEPAGLSLGALAGRTGLARSTVQRIVQALETEGFVEPSGPGGGFRLGPAFSELVYRRQIDIVTEARPILEALCAGLGETVALCGLAGGQVVAIDRCIAERPLRVVFPLGTIPFAPHKLAPGRAILAALPRAQAAELLAAHLPPGAVAEELDRLQADPAPGRDLEPFIPDLSGLAVPLHSFLGTFAIAAIVPDCRLGAREATIIAALASARSTIEARLGAG